jgi:outer membrane protein assembly factor BamA
MRMEMLALLLSLTLSFNNVVALDSGMYLPSDSVTHVSEKDLPVTIDNIFFIGNKVTKEDIMLREMSINRGDVYNKQDLENILVLDKSKLINTRLFNSVEISILHLSETLIDVVVNVSERWYTFPVPIFDLVDRNFNDWWQNQDKDFSRTNLGIKLYRNNFRGRNEALRLLLQLGYTKQFGITYKIPYLDANKQHGITLNFDYAENKNIAVRTVNHKPVFFDSEETLRIRRNYAIGYNYRRSFYSFHSFNIEYNYNTINDTIVGINPEYYEPEKITQRFFELTYTFTYDRRDAAPYPLKGHRLDVLVEKQGIGAFDDIDRAEINVNYTKFLDLGKGFYVANYLSGLSSLPSRQPYSNLGALGYRKDFIRGYELYLIESKNFILNRTTFKKRLLSVIGNMRFLPIDQFKKIPLDIYFKVYFDSGYAENFENYDLNTTLSDRYLFGTGAGIDFVTYYDSVIRLEYSVNRENQAGFFLHFKKEF